MSADRVSQYLSSILNRPQRREGPTPDDDGRRTAQDREKDFSGRRRGAKKRKPGKGSTVRTYLIVILACTAGTTVIRGLAILGLHRLLALVREQKAAENPRKPLHVCKLPKLHVR